MLDLDDPAWKNPPDPDNPTLVKAFVLVDQLSEIDTAKSTAVVKIGVWLHWSDPRLSFARISAALPTSLWTPRPEIRESKADMNITMTELRHEGNGQMYSLTWFEGTIKNLMEEFKLFFRSILMRSSLLSPGVTAIRKTER